MGIITNHWTVNKVPKSERQEQIESSLCLYIPGVPFSRWLLFISAFIIQFCCGSLYSWSVLNKPIDLYVYGDAAAGKAPITFYLAVGSFGTTAMFLGPWLERNGPRNGLLLGSLTFGVGNAIAAISLQYKSIVGVYIGYGLLGGFGLGLNYISPVSALQKWFPDYRGLASGFAVGGFGAGSIVWSKVYIPLIAAVGLPAAFGVLGVGITSILLFAAIAQRTPPNNFSSHVFGATNTHFEDKDAEKQSKNAYDQNASSSDLSHERPHEYSLIESIRSPDFAFLYLMFFCNQIFGLVALSLLSSMIQDLFKKTADEGATVVAINGIFNCVGRLFFPMVSDLIIKFFGNGGHNFHPSAARKCIFFITLGVQIVVVALLPTLMESGSYGGFRAVMWILTACYGAGFGSIPAFLTDMWGPYNIGALHGIMLTAWSIGGIAGGIGFNANVVSHKPLGPVAQYESNLTWVLALLIVGFVLLFFVRTNPKDRQERGYRFSIFGIRLFHFGA